MSRPAASVVHGSLRYGEAHLWVLQVPPGVGNLLLDLTQLSAAEHLRLAAYRRVTDRKQYAAAHVALRRVLALYTGLDAADLRFGRDPCARCGTSHGRPVLLDGPGGVNFSLSHSSGAVLIAVAASPVGTDIQRRPSETTTELCLPALHPLERQELASLADQPRAAAFGRLWTRKEAYLKGLGTGLGRGLGTDYLGSVVASRPSGWQVVDVPVDPGYDAAVALLTDRDRCATSLRRLTVAALTAEAPRLSAAARCRAGSG